MNLEPLVRLANFLLLLAMLLHVRSLFRDFHHMAILQAKGDSAGKSLEDFLQDISDNPVNKLEVCM